MPSHCYPCFDVATQPQTAIDYYYGDSNNRQGNYTIGSWADDSLHESYAVETDLPETRTDEYDEDYHREKSIEYHSLAMDDIGFLPASFTDAMLPSINSNNRLSIDDHQKPNLEVQVKDNTNYGYLTPNEFGIFRDPEGQAREMDGRILNIS